MVSLGGIGSTLTSAMFSWGFWLIMGVFIIGVTFGSLYMRKLGKFHYKAVIITDNGNGKVGLKFTKAGWFKSKKLLGGLWEWKGEKRLEVKDGRFVQQGSSADFHEIDYKAGLILQEKADDNNVLLPVNKMLLNEKAQQVIMNLAPSDFRDASSKIIEDARKESLSKFGEIAQILVIGFVAIVLFVSIILVIQYSKNQMQTASAEYQKALAFYERVLSHTSAVPSQSTAP